MTEKTSDEVFIYDHSDHHKFYYAIKFPEGYYLKQRISDNTIVYTDSIHSACKWGSPKKALISITDVLLCTPYGDQYVYDVHVFAKTEIYTRVQCHDKEELVESLWGDNSAL